MSSFRGKDSNYWFSDPSKTEHSIGLRMVEHKKQLLEGNTPHFPSVASNLGKLKQTVMLTSYFNSKLPIYAKTKLVYYTSFPKLPCCTLKNMQNNWTASTHCGVRKPLAIVSDRHTQLVANSQDGAFWLGRAGSCLAIQQEPTFHPCFVTWQRHTPILSHTRNILYTCSLSSKQWNKALNYTINRLPVHGLM